jgi:hypothetical protein
MKAESWDWTGLWFPEHHLDDMEVMGNRLWAYPAGWPARFPDEVGSSSVDKAAYPSRNTTSVILSSTALTRSSMSLSTAESRDSFRFETCRRSATRTTAGPK